MKVQPHQTACIARPSKIPYFALNETTGKYEARRALSGEQIIKAALRLAKGGMSGSEPITSPQAAHQYVALALGNREQEVFACIWLDSRHRVMEMEELFYGTIDGASVHPREVVKRALAHNAAAVIAVHNHPSGVAEPSASDTSITRRLKEALSLVDIRLLDHFIVGGDETTSLAERGLM